MTALAFLSVFTFFKIQERDYINMLNNYNLSPNAYALTFKPDTMIGTIDQKLEKSNIKDVQVHYRPKNNKQVTYFYGKGDFVVPPMMKGGFFADADFQSYISVAVVGKSLQKELYTPKDQSYIKYQGNYIPVVGVMGDKCKSDLDKQIFFTIPLKQAKTMEVAHYTVALDSQDHLSAQRLRQLLPIVKIKKIQKNNMLVPKASWATQYWVQALGLIGVIIGDLLILFGWIITSHKLYAKALFANKPLVRFIFEQWERYSLYTAIGWIVGTCLGFFVYKLNVQTNLIIFNITIYVLSSILFYYGLNRYYEKKPKIK